MFTAKGKFLKIGALFFEKKKGFGYSPKPFEFYSEQLTNYLRRRYVVNCNIKLHLNNYSIYSNFSRKSYTKNLNFFHKEVLRLASGKMRRAPTYCRFLQNNLAYNKLRLYISNSAANWVFANSAAKATFGHSSLCPPFGICIKLIFDESFAAFW